MAEYSARRRMMVAGNWKMHGDIAQVERLLGACLQQAAAFSHTEIVVAPVAVHLALASALLEGSAVKLAAQNASGYAPGAYTGEVAAGMLAELGCHYVVVGHSERRSLFAESDQQVAAKVVSVQQTGMLPVLCVGESLEQREAGETFAVIAAQLDAVLKEAGVDAFDQMVIAYEPVWAIGTGRAASVDEAQAVHEEIRRWVSAHCGKNCANELRVLYGGSVKPDNALQLFSAPDIDGGLIGGAALNPDDFMAIVAAAEEVVMGG